MMSSYDCKTGKIEIAPGATLYARFHEEAHKEQHHTKAVIWRLWWHGRWFHGVQWLTTVLVEFDAYRRARRNMIRLDLWKPEYETEARLDLLSYFTKKALKAL
jgi:hypothetical protein